MSNIVPPGPLAYEGTIAIPTTVQTKDPTTGFNAYDVPTIWVNTDKVNSYANPRSFILVAKPAGVAKWQELSSSGSGNVTQVLGTSGQIVVTPNTGMPVVSIDPTYVGQGSITTLGTITSGTWHGSVIPLANGGTNANLTATTNNLVYSTATAMALLATANNGALITSAGGVPSISSTLPAAVQGNITATGTVASGTWHGSVIAGQYGGTGVANTGQTITLSSGGAGYVLTSDSSGNGSWSLIPAFSSILSVNDATATGGGTTYVLGSGNILSIIAQTGTGMSTNGTFTAPIQGMYHFTAVIYMSGLTAAMTSGIYYFLINGVNVILGETSNSGAQRTSGNLLAVNISAEFFLGATGTVQVACQIANGADVVTINGGAGGPTTVFSGFLVAGT